MRPSTAVRNLAAAFAIVLLFAPEIAAPQSPAPTRIRGEIQAVQDDALAVRERSGESVRLTLSEPLAVLAVVKADIGRIAPGSYIGSAALPQSDGTLKALEVVVFPEAMRGVGEGHYPWDLTPETTMTNAAVESVVGEVSGRVLKLKYKDGEKTLLVPPEAPIVTLEPGDRSLLKPGNHVFINAVRQPDGSLAASRIAVGKDGLVPPM